MAKEERGSGDEVATRLVVLFVPIVLTAHLLSLRLPKAIAWAVSMFAWMLAIYWLPSRTDLSLRRWLIIVSASAVLAFLLATIQPGMF
jgi:lysylphosphatidylglycerol synthetase-like protein (DUF2156 family)